MSKQRTPMAGAGDTAVRYLAQGVQALDHHFGEGYAVIHPALLAGFMQTCALDFLADVLTTIGDQQAYQVAALEDAAGRIGDCASELESIAVAILEGKDGRAELPHIDPLCSRCRARHWVIKPGREGAKGPAYCRQCFREMERQEFPLASALRNSESRPCGLSDAELTFRIGGDGACLDQVPSFKRLAFHVIGKADGLGLYALGGLIGDAFLKLNRPVPVAADAPFTSDSCSSWLMELADGLPVSPELDGMRSAFLFRVGEFLDIATNCPARLLEILARIDALSNDRLSQRCRAILETGRDPGEGDLWATHLAEPEK